MRKVLLTLLFTIKCGIAIAQLLPTDSEHFKPGMVTDTQARIIERDAKVDRALRAIISAMNNLDKRVKALEVKK